ncbi:hypothetical protein CDL12_26224 [Handroanthus impetiginosus]|uniref:K-box domain-containing protein n=1 Tax=Handroanthus impetiginosus TaxID=429701 RepID=A0A2G9G7I4_9LAMI|nr:hypothetical protein CDL12_26224 [Handroanthus impetiginosus]
MQHLKHEAAMMSRKIELLENSRRKLLGHNLGTCSMEELQDIDKQLQRSLKNIRSRKDQLFKEDIQKLQTKEKFLLEENKRLREKNGPKQRHVQDKEQEEIGSGSLSTQCSDVGTELCIGPPKYSIV